MRPIEETQRYMIILLLFILLAFSGLTPHSHIFKDGLQEANRSIASGAHLQAADAIADASQQQPWQTNLWEKAGHFALIGNDPQTAIEFLKKPSLENNSPIFPQKQKLSVLGLTELGQAYQKTGNFDAAFDTWQKAEIQYGPSIEILKHRVSAYLVQGDFPSAITELHHLNNIQPDNPWIEYQLGLLLATQDPDSALSHLKRAAELDPEISPTVETIHHSILSASYAEDIAYSLLSAGRALATSNEWELAAEAFRQAILTKPEYAEAWAYLGETRQHLDSDAASQKNIQDGLNEIYTALELDPESLAAYSFLALYWERHDRYDLALEAMQKASSFDPNNALLQAELAGIQAASGDLKGAYDSYQKAVEMAPNDPAYQRQLITFSLTYDYQVEEIALPKARRLVIYAGQNPDNLDLMAQVLIKQGDLNNAERFLQRALKSDPNFGPAHLHLGLVYVLGPNPKNAYQEFNLAKSLSPNPNDPTAEHAQRLLNTHFP